jgi:hypothetical protein
MQSVRVRLLSAFFVLSFTLTASPIVTSALYASLDMGSLAGTAFPVSFSYDAGQVLPVGDSFVLLTTFDFVLLGVPFDKAEIFQGGQAIFHNGILTDVTASSQVFLPPMSPVENITFGFGGVGVIGYIDLNGQFGQGSFTFTSAPELSTFLITSGGLTILFIIQRRGALTSLHERPGRYTRPCFHGCGLGDGRIFPLHKVHSPGGCRTDGPIFARPQSYRVPWWLPEAPTVNRNFPALRSGIISAGPRVISHDPRLTVISKRCLPTLIRILWTQPSSGGSGLS